MDVWKGMQASAGFRKYEKVLGRIEYADLTAVLCQKLVRLPEELGECVVLEKSVQDLPAGYSMKQLEANFMDCTGFEASHNEQFLSAGHLAKQGKRVPFRTVLALGMLMVQVLAQQLRQRYPDRQFEIVLCAQKRFKSVNWRFYTLRKDEPPWLGELEGFASGEIVAKFRIG